MHADPIVERPICARPQTDHCSAYNHQPGADACDNHDNNQRHYEPLNQALFRRVVLVITDAFRQYIGYGIGVRDVVGIEVFVKVLFIVVFDRMDIA